MNTLSYRRVGRGIWCIACGSFSLILLLVSGILTYGFGYHDYHEPFWNPIRPAFSGVAFLISGYLLWKQGLHLYYIFFRQPLPAYRMVAVEAGLLLLSFALLLYPLYELMTGATVN